MLNCMVIIDEKTISPPLDLLPYRWSFTVHWHPSLDTESTSPLHKYDVRQDPRHRPRYHEESEKHFLLANIPYVCISHAFDIGTRRSRMP